MWKKMSEKAKYLNKNKLLKYQHSQPECSERAERFDVFEMAQKLQNEVQFIYDVIFYMQMKVNLM